MMLYLIKSSAVLLVLLLFYKAFLENEKAFVFNRIYLLSALVLCLISPFITYEVSIEWAQFILPEQTLQSSYNITSTDQINEQGTITSPINWAMILSLIYGLGFILMFVRFNKNFYGLIKQCKKANSLNKDGYKVIIQGSKTIPYSFLNYIFLPKDAAQEIFEHEKRHADAYHSVDIIISELLIILFWFNPLFHWHKKLLKENHEFYADASPKNIDLTKYNLLIFKQINKNKANSLASGFDSSIIKKRIIMLQKSKSSPLLWAKKLMVVPLFTLLILGACEKITSQEKQTINSSKLIQNELLIQVDGKTTNDALIFYKGVTNPLNPSKAKELLQSMNLEDMDELTFEINGKKYEGSQLSKIEYTQKKEELFMRKLASSSGILKLNIKDKSNGQKTRSIQLGNGKNKSAIYTGDNVPPPPPPPIVSVPAPPEPPSVINAPAPPTPPLPVEGIKNSPPPAPPAPPNAASAPPPPPPAPPKASSVPPPPPPPPAPPESIEELNYHINHIENDLINYEKGNLKLSKEDIKKSKKLLKQLKDKKKEIKE